MTVADLCAFVGALCAFGMLIIEVIKIARKG